MFKKIFVFFLILFLFTILPKNIYASDEFKIDLTSYYRLKADGGVNVTQKIRLENLVSDLYATSYSMEFDNIKPIDAKADQDGKPLVLTSKEESDKTLLTVNFSEPVVGRGNVRNFEITFDENTFATRTGEIWEIAIPRLSQDASFNSYALYLIVPESFGQQAYMSPEPDSEITSEGDRVYAYTRSDVAKTGISAGFGQFQVFSYDLNYHLENPISKTTNVDIAIPPDTAFQKVYINTINPKPENIYLDTDGNWIATYALTPKERVDVSVKGAVQIFASPRPFFKPSQEILNENLKSSDFWQVDDAKIQELAGKLKDAKGIYDYVSGTLTYDFDRVKPNVSRLGAAVALENPNLAICTEYTDLFVALARAAGIPAREINGYAYSENPEIQPLSLVADVLHAWPEYYNTEKKAWIPVDPTWGSTTGGVDFFNKLDLRHFTFVIHGLDSTKPYPPGSYKLGPNPQKDIFVNFGQLPEKKTSTPQIKLTPLAFSFSGRKYSVEIYNPGPVAIYDTSYSIYFDSLLNTKQRVDVFLPYSSLNSQVLIPFSFLARKTPSKLEVIFQDAKVSAPINRSQIIIVQLLFIFFALTILVTASVFRLKRISVKLLAQNTKSRIITVVQKIVYGFKNKIFKKPQNPV